MSDTFNPTHYLDKRLTDEVALPPIPFDWKKHLELRKQQFPTFSFVVISHSKILFNELDTNQPADKSNQVVILAKHLNVFLICLHETKNEKENSFIIPKSCSIVHEDIALTKSKQNNHFFFGGNNEYLHLDNHITNQLFFNSATFKITGKVNSRFLSVQSKQRHKNDIVYTLEPESNLKHISFSDISEGQLQDDSLTIIHGNSSHSEIFYESLNRGKIASQINSVIPKQSNKCSTHQHIKHTVLNKHAITNSKPNLMIENPDVEASHGNSIGSFRNEDLFYLQQRGLSEEESYSVLSKSRINDFISKSPFVAELNSYLKKQNE